MADEDAPLHGPERDLMRLAARDAPDEFLMALQAMAKQRLHEQVGLLVNGMIVIGELGDPEVLASLLQVRRGAQIERAERPDGLTDAEWDELAQDWISEPVRMVEDFQAREAALDEALEPYLSGDDSPPRSREIPGEMERQLEGFRTSSHITLTNATITAAGVNATTSVPVMRIAIRQVAGWWLAPLNEDGTTSISLWGGEPRIFGDAD
ncbi:MAG: hypothetical protein J7513_13605 [Solirubrobacteraceae bacterium]|nr:hypothetical protein [Solirubrobacteraceae bacterium]